MEVVLGAKTPGKWWCWTVAGASAPDLEFVGPILQSPQGMPASFRSEEFLPWLICASFFPYHGLVIVIMPSSGNDMRACMRVSKKSGAVKIDPK